jgi:tRNA 2-thiouridine synthesizing protein C
VAETSAKKRHLLVIRRTPYGSGLARASVDLGLAMGAFDQEFDLLFLGDGVLQLLQKQESASIGLKNVGKALSSLPLYDVESVYVDMAALKRHGISKEQLVVPVIALDDHGLKQLLAQCDHLVGC